MDFQAIIDKYYPEKGELRQTLMVHSRSVADKALRLAGLHPEMNLDTTFIEEAAMLHDLGVFRCNAPDIFCFGNQPYICHGSIGAEILRAEGFERHALVCERHTGTGLTLDYILQNDLPIPHRNLCPVSLEEQIICYADKFFSKTRLDSEKTPEQALKSVSKWGTDCAEKFKEWMQMFE